MKKTLTLAAVLMLVLVPTTFAGYQAQGKLTLGQRVAKQDRELREMRRLLGIMQDTVYLKDTGVLPMTLQNRMAVKRVEVQTEAAFAGLVDCLRWRSVTLPGQSGPDRVAVVHPVCLHIRELR
jgi:hypothetical protein